ncbi:MAG: CopG family transcriptional regulator [Bacillota bacterium]
METQNITLAVPKDVLRRIKHLAVQKDKSVSRMLTEALIELVVREDQYMQARTHHSDMLAQVRDLGTEGRIAYAREDLHDRK